MCNGCGQDYDHKESKNGNQNTFSVSNEDRRITMEAGSLSNSLVRNSIKSGMPGFPKRAPKMFDLNQNVIITIQQVFPKLKVDYQDIASKFQYPYVVPMASRTLNMKAPISPVVYLNPDMTYQGAMSVQFEEFENKSSKETPIPYGEGIIIYSDGSTYSGQFNNSPTSTLDDPIKHGQGINFLKDGSFYVGEFINNEADGMGLFYFADGSLYKGGFEKNKQHGYGEERRSTGTIYKGGFKNGFKHGHGELKWYENKNKNAFMIHAGSRTSIKNIESKHKMLGHYRGEFLHNMMNGQGNPPLNFNFNFLGTYNWPDGRFYKGSWKDNKMDGKGVFTWPDGRKYDGEYFQDLKHGMGVFRW